MSQEHVLYISYDGMTDPLGQSQVIAYLSGLSQKGYKFHLISFEKPDNFKAHKNYIQDLCFENNISWYPHVYTKNPPVFSTLRDIKKMKKKAFKLQEKHNIKIVHCRSYIPALVGLELKNKRNTKFLFDMRGFWADERIDGKIWDITNPLFKQIYKYFKRKEIQYLTWADYTVSLTENGKSEILSWNRFKENPIKIEVIPCCADVDKFDISNIDIAVKSTYQKELGLSSNNFVLGYIGSIGTWYMLDEMMQYYTVLRTKKENSKFLFISGEKPEKIKEVALKYNIPEQEILVKSVLHKDVPTCISLFDLSVFFIRPTYSKKASSPVKQGEIMAMGIPLVCNAGVGDTDLIVNQAKAGYIFKELSLEKFKTSSFEFDCFNRDEITSFSKNFYSLTEGVNKYAKIYKELIK